MFNLVVLTGRLTADPELKTTPNGVSVTTFSIAVSRRYRAGEETQADFINIVAWRQTAEFITKYFKKGSRIGLTGRIQSGSYTNQKGDKVYTTDIVADEVEFLDEKPKEEPTQTEIVQKAMNENPYEEFGKQIAIDDSSLPF